MKRTLIALTAGLAVLCGCQEPEFEMQEGVKVMAAGRPIDSEAGHLVPCLSDWNADGKPDLIVGEFWHGAIRLYLNQGTAAKPEFQDFSFLRAGGEPIRLEAS